MTETPVLETSEPTPGGSATSTLDHAALAKQRRLRLVRRIAVSVWALALVAYTLKYGIPADRYLVIAWAVVGLAAFTIGRRAIWSIAVDWAPFAIALAAWDRTRGAADALGRSVLWTPQIDFDKALFGRSLNVYLQAHLKQATPPWWEAIVSLTYVSFYVVPYSVAAFMWLRNRRSYWRYTVRFFTISFTAALLFAVFPAAPPWAAARCTPAQVASGPSHPKCMNHKATKAVNRTGGLLGHLEPSHVGAVSHIQRISTRGLTVLHAQRGAKLVTQGQAVSNKVAAIPSLHAGESMLVAVFLWPLLAKRRRWRALLVAYPLMMAFTLIYTGEHYLLDILAGWALTAVVCLGFSTWERHRAGRPRRAFRLPWTTPPSEHIEDSPWQPTGTTPSSTWPSDEASSSPPPTSTAVPARPGTTAPSA